MRYLLSLPLAGLLLLSACTPEASDAEPVGPVTQDGPNAPVETDADLSPDDPAYPAGTSTAEAVAELRPVGGGDANANAILTASGDGVLLSVQVDGLEAAGLHGFHIHEGGSCARPGGLFNPDGYPHGGPSMPEGQRAAGSLGNINARADGVARYERFEPLVTLGGDRSVVGRTLVIHQRQDDFQSEPDGDSGPIIACGVIRPTDADAPTATETARPD